MPYRLKSARRKYWQEWHNKNKEAYNAKVRKRYHSKQRHNKAVEWRSDYEKTRRHQWRLEALAILGNKCLHCGEKDPDVLQIDHVKGGGLKELRKTKGNRNYFRKVHAHVKRGGKRYQLLCANCNWKKRRTNNEVPRGNLYSKRPANRR